jgi:vesicle-associated membrane protein 7
MPIYYCLVAHKTIVLANYAITAGNFLSVAHQILPGIDTETNHRFIYSHGQFLFHYICEDRLIYLCVTDLEYVRETAFLYLNAIRKRFLATYGLQAALAGELALDAEFSRVLATELANIDQYQDKVSLVSSQVAEVKNVMEVNIEKMIDRGDNLQRVMEQVDGLNRTVSEK